MNRHQRRAGKKQEGTGSFHPPGLFARACRHHEAGNLQEAVRLYQQILQTDPRNAQVLYQFGLAAQRLGRRDAAAELIGRAIDEDGSQAAYHNDLGNILYELGRFEPAIVAFRQALKLKPDLDLAHFNLGIALRHSGRTAEAIDAFLQVTRHRPDHVEAHNNLGLAFLALGRLDEAETAFVTALGHQPTFAEAHCNLGVMLYERGRVAEALSCFLHALALSPTLAEAHNGLGNTLERRGDLAAAEIAFGHALANRPDYAEAHHNLAVTYKEQTRFGEALASFDRALAFKPQLIEARVARGMTLLQTGDWAGGWRDYEYRWVQSEEVARRAAGFSRPLWNGEEGRDRTILLWAEQAFGDTIQFARFAPELMKRGWRVALEVHPELARLFFSLAGVTVVARGEALPVFDCHCPLLSVPGKLGVTLDTLPAPASYLRADRETVLKWRAKLARGRGFRIGVNWRGRETQKREVRRAIRPERFADCLAVAGLDVVNLQKDAHQADLTALAPRGLLHDAGPSLSDFAETAAVMSTLDLVISSDTAVLHLAGALGVPAWGLLDHASDWQWLTGRADSPWYPSVRLFRQPRRGDWGPVMAEVRRALDDLLAERVSAIQAAG